MSASGTVTHLFSKHRKGGSFAFHRNGTFAGLLVGYMGYYLCRQNIGVAFTLMEKTLGMTKMQYGTIASVGTLVYALGKLLTGALADSRGGRFVFFLGLVGTVVSSLLFSTGSTLSFFIVFWAFNRFFQSMGWGGLVNILARWFRTSKYGTAMGIMSASYQFGGGVATLFAGSILAWGFGWRAVFWMPAVALAIIGVLIFPFVVGHPHHVGHQVPHDVLPDFESTGARVKVISHPSDEKPQGYFENFKIVLADPMFLLMCGLSFVLTFLRECFNTWMPAYFSEMGASASVAGFKSAVFPFLGFAGTLAAGWFSDRFMEGRRGPVMAGLLVGLIIVLFGLAHLDGLVVAAQACGIGWIGRGSLSVVLVGLAGFFLLGPYSFVGGVVALDFGGRRTSGTAAGLLDSAGYLAATAAGIGMAQMVVSQGWSQAFSWMSVLSAISLIFCGLLWKVKPRAHHG